MKIDIKKHLNNETLTIYTMIGLTLIVALLQGLTILQTIKLLLVLYIPGALILSLFSSKKELPDRYLLSFILSITILPFILFTLNVLFSIAITESLIVITAVTITLLLIIARTVQYLLLKRDS